MNPFSIEEIRTARLDLVPLRAEHAEEMAAVLADPALHAFIGGTPLTPDELRARYLRLEAGSPDPDVCWLNWVIRLRAEDRLVGTVQATVGPADDGDGVGVGVGVGRVGEGDGEGEGRVAEIAWIVGTPWQGGGIAGESARGLVGWLSRRPLRAVIAHIHPDHRASAAVAASAGLASTDEVHDGEIRWLYARAYGAEPDSGEHPA